MTSMSQDTIVKGRYRIIRFLGGGGQCFVYEVTDLQKNVNVVLKELRIETDDPDTFAEDIKMFKKEYEILSRLEHPLLPKGYDYFQEGENHFLVVQYIKGKNLEECLLERNNPFDEITVVRWAIDMAEVLQYLYNVKPYPVIVRDIKPSNIVVSDDGKPYLIDFSVGRELDPEQPGDTIRIGTNGYAPPEQYKGLTDGRSDIYSLGVTLYRLLTCYDPTEFPFQFSPVRHHNPSLSKKLEYVLNKALELDPVKRYQTPGDFLKDLKSVKDEISGVKEPEILQEDSKKVSFSEHYNKWNIMRKPIYLSCLLFILILIPLYNPLMLRARLYYGYSLYKNGDIDKSSDVYVSILKDFPGNLEACYYSGIIHFYKGNSLMAAGYFDIMSSDLNMMKEKSIYHYNMAKFYKEKDKNRAQKDFDIAKYLSCKIVQSSNIKEESLEDL